MNRFMRKFVQILLPLALFAAPLQADNAECLEAALDEMNDYYRTGAGCEDGIFNAISASMLGWGVGLFAGIALLTGLIHNAHQSSSSSSNNSSN